MRKAAAAVRKSLLLKWRWSDIRRRQVELWLKVRHIEEAYHNLLRKLAALLFELMKRNCSITAVDLTGD
jgi:hypothetical protein